MGDNNFLKGIFNKKDNPDESKEADLKIKAQKIDKLFREMIKDFLTPLDTPKNVYYKPFYEGISHMELIEALRQLGTGEKEEAVRLLEKMIEKALQIDPSPSWTERLEMQEVLGYIKEIDKKDLMHRVGSTNMYNAEKHFTEKEQ